jgi:nitroreductase
VNVSDVIAERRSIRVFQDRPVDMAVLRVVLDKARAAPSGGNCQPWHVTVLTGDSLAGLKSAIGMTLMTAPMGEVPDHEGYPSPLPSPWRERRFANAEALYASINVSREDKPARLAQVAKNFAFFGAPVGLIIHMPRFMALPQWADLGIWMQTVMLLLVEAGLGSCPQGAWARYPETIRRAIGLPDDHVVFAGMAIGWPDMDAPLNSFPNPRASLEETVRFLD